MIYSDTSSIVLDQSYVPELTLPGLEVELVFTNTTSAVVSLAITERARIVSCTITPEEVKSFVVCLPTGEGGPSGRRVKFTAAAEGYLPWVSFSPAHLARRGRLMFELVEGVFLERVDGDDSSDNGFFVEHKIIEVKKIRHN